MMLNPVMNADFDGVVIVRPQVWEQVSEKKKDSQHPARRQRLAGDPIPSHRRPEKKPRQREAHRQKGQRRGVRERALHDHEGRAPNERHQHQQGFGFRPHTQAKYLRGG